MSLRRSLASLRDERSKLQDSAGDEDEDESDGGYGGAFREEGAAEPNSDDDSTFGYQGGLLSSDAGDSENEEEDLLYDESDEDDYKIDLHCNAHSSDTLKTYLKEATSSTPLLIPKQIPFRCSPAYPTINPVAQNGIPKYCCRGGAERD